MTLDDKRKCSEIWFMVSGERIEPSDWNEKAGNELAGFLATLINCSSAMSFVPNPTGSAPGWGWVTKYVYEVFKTRYNMNKSLIFKSCIPASLSRYRSAIVTSCF